MNHFVSSNLTEKIAFYAEKISAMEVITSYDAKRKEKALYYLSRADINSGAFGRIDELLSRKHHSKKTEVATQGKDDTSVTVNGKNYGAERKTNGGRISGIKSRYVVYSLDICNSTTGNKRRTLEPMVFSLEGFLEILETAGAIKCTNGKKPEQAVQPSSLKMFRLMEQYGTPFDIDRNYSADEIY